MADSFDDFTNALRDFGKQYHPVPVLPAKVVAVHEPELTVDLVDFNDNEFFDVRLKASIDNDTDGAYDLPLINSYVLFASIGENNAQRFIVCCDKISKSVCKGSTP